MNRPTAPGETPGPSVLTAADVAAWLGVSNKWVYRLSREGRIPTIRIGRCIRFLPESIEEWLRDSESHAT